MDHLLFFRNNSSISGGAAAAFFCGGRSTAGGCLCRGLFCSRFFGFLYWCFCISVRFLFCCFCCQNSASISIFLYHCLSIHSFPEYGVCLQMMSGYLLCVIGHLFLMVSFWMGAENQIRKCPAIARRPAAKQYQEKYLNFLPRTTISSALIQM